MEYRLLSFEDYLDNVDYIYAHKKSEGDNIKYETLEEHSKLCIKYFSEIDKEKNIINKVVKIIKEIFKELEWEEDSEKLQFVADMFVNSIYLHDIGKSNPYFQIYNMDNKRFKVSGSVDKCHSMLSALIFADIYRKKLKDKNDNDWSKLEYFLYIFSFIISRHHSYLVDGMSESKFIEGFKQIKEYEPDLLLNYKEEINGKITKNNFIKSFTKFRSPKAYTLSKLLYSVLINCDFAATQEYMRGKKVDIIYSFDKQELINTEIRFVDYLTTVRLKRARFLLRETNMKVSDIADRLDYRDMGYFSRIFKKYFGINPSECRMDNSYSYQI